MCILYQVLKMGEQHTYQERDVCIGIKSNLISLWKYLSRRGVVWGENMCKVP